MLLKRVVLIVVVVQVRCCVIDNMLSHVKSDFDVLHPLCIHLVEVALTPAFFQPEGIVVVPAQ